MLSRFSTSSLWACALTTSLLVGQQTVDRPEVLRRSRYPELVTAIPEQRFDRPLTARSAGLSFVPNRGQFDPRVHFQTTGGSGEAWLHDRGFTMRHARHDLHGSRGVVTRYRFEGAALAEGIPADALPGRHHYLLGSDATAWRQNVPIFATVRYPAVWPGVDVVFREDHGSLRYDLECSDPSDLARVVIRVEGAEALRLAADGSLVVEGEFTDWWHSRPEAWSVDANGARSAVDVAFRILDGARFGFECTSQTTAGRLVVDPTIRQSTYAGGSGDENTHEVRRLANGDLLMTGRTASADFPTSVGGFQRTSGGGAWDAVVTRFDLNRSGAAQLQFATFVGGSGEDMFIDCEEAPDGRLWMCGMSDSADFPTTSGVYGRFRFGMRDAVLVALDATGASLLHGSYFGGTVAAGPAGEANTWASDLIVGADSTTILLGGHTECSDLPMLGGFQSVFAGGQEGWLARFDTVQTNQSELVWSTFLGGSGDEGYWGDGARPFDLNDLSLLVDAQGVLTVATQTNSPDFPVTPGSYQTALPGSTAMGSSSGVVVSIDPALPPAQQLLWGTYLGGPGPISGEVFYSLVAAPDGTFWLAGISYDPSFQTTPGAFEPVAPNHVGDGSHDGLLINLSGDGSSVLYASYLGGSESATGLDIDLEAGGTIVGGGFTFGYVPTTVLCQFPNRLSSPAPDAFTVRIRPEARGRADLVYCSYLGGTGGEALFGVDAHGGDNGAVAFCGVAASVDFPVSNTAFQTVKAGGPRDGWIAELDLLPQSISRVAAANACAAEQFLSIAGGPSKSAGAFGLLVHGVDSQTMVVFAVGTRASSPLPLLNIELAVTPVFDVVVTADTAGLAQLTVPVAPSTPSGFTLALQAISIGQNGCAPLRSAGALEFTIRP